MNHYERIIELITENRASKMRSYEIAKKHGLLGRGDNEFVDLPSGRQGVRNPGRRGEPGTGKGGREQFVTDDDGEYYPYRPEENAPRRKKRRVKESVDFVNERKGAAFARRQEKKAERLKNNPATAGTPQAQAARDRATKATMNRYAKQGHRAGVSPDDTREFARTKLSPKELLDPISSERLSRARYIGSKAHDLHSAGVKKAKAAGTFGIPRTKKKKKTQG